MSRLELSPHWPEILRLKDELSLKALAARFETTPGAISAALKRQGTARVATARPHDDELPPEPGEAGDDGDGDDDDMSIRAGSKDALIARHLDLLGKRPDAEVARKAGVSVRTIASFRARHGIQGYRGPRRTGASRGPRRSRIDPFAHLLGKVPDRVVAERAEVSLNAVRNYRVKRGISALGRRGGEVEAPRPEAARVVATGSQAWSVTWRDGGVESTGIVVATDLVEAARQALAAGIPGEIVQLRLAGDLLA